ncbi:pentapeptide repeat-containing protein [Enterobacillus tribolii]|uniref:Uncharacterized protein YjbI with pentapeptide repeats n=1 Tax=Enterobacillus tribolii TaxID=1487935 RepID=A0A370QEN6_9GAMM|nr:pentapeptide repeat-containing protein [Enterobacillus tribolii]MBW7984127.1 pentapeptide repeat-containing protein [Enterobacillus tribolii]RDK86811.1 uncharacterized protein YjbI with pentapeptide repeats [Enterobacillus tribolii]
MTGLQDQGAIPDKPRRIVGKSFRRRKIGSLALAQVCFTDCIFTDLEIGDLTAQGLHFERCQFRNVRFLGGRLDVCTLQQCQVDNFSAQDFSMFNFSCLESTWREIRLQECLIERWMMSGCRLEQAQWQNVRISYWTAQNTPVDGLTMTDGEMQDGNWHGCVLRRIDWKNTSLIRQVMGSCILEECRYKDNACDILVWSSCQLRGLDLRNLNLANAGFQNSRLQECRFEKCSLEAAQFNGADILRCDFSQANLSNAQFTDATLTGCGFTSARLTRASLLRAKLVKCSLVRADLSHADMRYSDLKTTLLQSAITDKTRLHGAQLQILDCALQTPEPLMGQIDNWYQHHQPGPVEPAQFPPLPSGASRYV